MDENEHTRNERTPENDERRPNEKKLGSILRQQGHLRTKIMDFLSSKRHTLNYNIY